MRARRLATLALTPALALGLGLTGIPSASAAGRGAAARAAGALPDLDDFSTNPAYARWYGQKVTWAQNLCPDTAESDAGLPLQCARLSVPRDWYHADRGSITVTISRAARSNAEPRAPRLLLTNPGGPGGTGLSFGPLVGISAGVDRTHEVVGIDPRGVGASTPAVCSPPALPSSSFESDADARSVTRSSFLADASYRAAVNAACRRQLANLLPYLTSDQTARDFNLVRAVLGYEQTDVYGVSYGTWLGSLLDRMFPGRVDRIVLDGNTDWSGGSLERVFGYQPQSFQASYDRLYLPFVARHADRFHLGSDPRAVDTLVERVRAAAGRRVFGPGITPDAVDGMLVVTQYSTQLWGETGRMLGLLDAATRGDRSGLQTVESYLNRLFESTPDAGTVQLAVTCNDTRWTQDPNTWFDAHIGEVQRLPLASASYLAMSCHGWTNGPALSAALLARPVQGVLMLHTEGDPATAYRGAWSTHMTTPGTRMLLVDDGAGHGAALSYPCATQAMADYLERGIYPAADVVCQAPPLETTIGPAVVADSRSYELFNPASGSTLPTPVWYLHRDLRPSVPDGKASTRVRVASVRAVAASRAQVLLARAAAVGVRGLVGR